MTMEPIDLDRLFDLDREKQGLLETIPEASTDTYRASYCGYSVGHEAAPASPERFACIGGHGTEP